MPQFSRRHVLQGATALTATVFAQPLRAQAPAAASITPELIAAARKEGKVAFYTAMDLPVAEKLGKAFEARYSGITVRVERTGSERLFQRIAQEYGSNIRAADVINSADAAHFIVWKRNGWLEPYLPEEVARHFPAWIVGRHARQRLAPETSRIGVAAILHSGHRLIDPWRRIVAERARLLEHAQRVRGDSVMIHTHH